MKRFLGFAALAAIVLGLYLNTATLAQQSGASCPIALQAPVLVTGTTYALSATDGCKMLVFTSGSAVTVTPPTPASNLPVGWRAWIKVQGAGGVTVATPSLSTVLVDGVNGPISMAQGTGMPIATDGANYYTGGLGVSHHP